MPPPHIAVADNSAAPIALLQYATAISAGLPRHHGLLLTPRCSNGLARRCAQARGLRPSSVRLLSAVCVCANKEIMLLTIEMRRKIEKGTLACAREDIDERVPAPALSPPVLHTVVCTPLPRLRSYSVEKQCKSGIWVPQRCR